ECEPGRREERTGGRLVEEPERQERTERVQTAEERGQTEQANRTRNRSRDETQRRRWDASWQHQRRGLELFLRRRRPDLASHAACSGLNGGNATRCPGIVVSACSTPPVSYLGVTSRCRPRAAPTRSPSAAGPRPLQWSGLRGCARGRHAARRW